MEVIKSYLAKQGKSIEVLTALYDALPPDAWLDDVRYEEDQKFSVKGTSGVKGSVFSLVADLEKSKKFKSVKTKYVTSRNEGEKEVQDFEISALIDGKGSE